MLRDDSFSAESTTAENEKFARARPSLPLLKPSGGLVCVHGFSVSIGETSDSGALFAALLAGRDLVRSAPPDRVELTGLAHQGAFLSNEVVWHFDHEFWNMSFRQARRTDPRQRLLLTQSFLAVENAGVSAERLSEMQTGSFVGVWCDYRDVFQLHIKSKNQISSAPGSDTANMV
jgi:acyl transferase domain-containing protein